jgi:hypothetical protein
MSLIPTVVESVAATNAADISFSRRILVAIAAAVLFGLIGLVPLLGTSRSRSQPARFDFS